MDTEVSANKTRGPRRVGLKRPSYSGKAVGLDTLNSSAAEDVERKTVSPAPPSTTDNESKSPDVSAGLRLDSSNVKSEDIKAEPHNGDKETASKIKKESNEENGSSEDSEEFCGFQPAPETKPIRVLTKLLGEAQSELDSENNMSAEEEKMDVDPEIDDAKRVAHNITDDGIVKSTKKRKMKEEAVDENGSASEDDKTKEADGSFDNMKLLSEVSSEVTSSNDVTNTNTNDISAKATEDVASEVTSSATNSPSLSTSRSSMKATARKGQESPATVSRRSMAKKSTVDLSSPAFRKPFDYGWKRELVYRNSNESSARVMADVYYYTPGNKKIRSNREVSDHLRGTDLTTDNFTFFKEALGVEDPEKEIIRVAKRVSGVGLSLPKSPQMKKLPTPKTPKTPREPKEVKDSSKNSSPDTSSADAKPAASASGPRAASRTFPRIKITPSQLMRTSVAASGGGGGGGKAKGKKIRSPSDDGDMEMGMLPPNWNQATVKGGQGTEPCSLACFGSEMARIPTLQCRLCLCMYHPDCVGLSRINQRILLGYVCKKCQQDKKDGRTSPPPLTKIASLPPPLTLKPSGAAGAANPACVTDGAHLSPPKLKRIPRLNSDTKFTTVPRFLKLQGQGDAAAPKTYASVKGQQPMVGGVTTWLPPSSTIQMTSPKGNATSPNSTADSPEASGMPCVQSIANIAGQKYIVVSKHTVVSVSNPPPQATTGAASTAKQIEGGPSWDGAGFVSASAAHGMTMAAISPGGDASQTAQAPGAGGPILPKPATTYVLSSGGGLQNPPGVYLVPWVASGPAAAPAQLPADGADGAGQPAQQQQLYLVNGPGGNYVLGQVRMDATATSAAEGHETSSSSKKRKRDGGGEKDAAGGAAAPAKRGKKSHDQCELEQAAMRGFANNVAAGYNAMLQIFQYLKVKELSRAAQVCKMWRDLAGHPSLWRIVRMKNSQVDDWAGFVTALVRRNAHTLDMRKMLLPNDPDDIAKMWRSFLREVSRATSLSRVDLCRCPAAVIEALPAACPQLTVINALAIKCSSISLDSMASLADLHELRLKSMTGIHLSSSLEPLRKFTNLRHLALTTFKDLGKAEPEVISCLTNLETLELGECSDFAEQFGRDVIPKLTKLTSLRLEKGQGKTCPTFSLLGGVKELPSLNQLELVNFDVKPGFSEALAQCTNIKRLLIIPTYVTQSATTNHMVLMGVTELKESLSHFVWGVTHELLRVTELFIDQCDQQTMPKDSKPPKISKHPDSIPILKPDKSKAPEWDSADCKSMNSPVGQVEILTLAKLQQVLVKSLPNTKIKILKVPFQSTWRQSISEPNA